MNKPFHIILMLCLLHVACLAQEDSARTDKLKFSADFRFRFEHDWNSKKPDGSFREDRFRLRYRLRFGFVYRYNQLITMGARIRTGDPRKQQDPQLTLGDGFGEFNTLLIGFEKVFVGFKKKGFNIWIGKNTFPFVKQNELFWSDNVYPEGIFSSKYFDLKSPFIQTIGISVGHFIVVTNGTALKNDGYFQGVQIHTRHWNDRLQFFPAIYNFQNMPNIPDGNDTYNLNYKVFHFGSNVKVSRNPEVSFGMDYYLNLENLSKVDSIPATFQNQKTGIVTSASFGKLENKGDWVIRVTYSYLERYAAVDFLAQNDWARWDYSSFGSPDGRLTNYRGLELMLGYAFSKHFTINTRYFKVEQLEPFNTFKETGNRIRLDLDIGF